jgi:AcrR family transcriptional regulator
VITMQARDNDRRWAGLRQRQRDFTRTHILAAGLEAFAERGYSQVTVDWLLERCGCARGTFYSYFPGGRDELFQAIYRQIGEEFAARFAEVLDDAGDDLAAVIHGAAEILMDISSEPGKGRFFMIEAPALPHVLGATLGRTSRGIATALSERIQLAQSRGSIDKSLDADQLSQLAVGMLRTVAIQVAEGTATQKRLIDTLDALISGALDVQRGRGRGARGTAGP